MDDTKRIPILPGLLGLLHAVLRGILTPLRALFIASPLGRLQSDRRPASITTDATGDLRIQLEEARERVAVLEAAYNTQVCQHLSAIGSPQEPGRPVRIFVDGAFDMTHFGHMNAFRQARSLGDYLVVGVNSDVSVAECKGSTPVLTDAERQAAVAACRFVDEIIPASPYVMTEDYIQELILVHNIDYFVHGDDPCIVNGRDVYEAAKKAGRYQSIPRTEGISTTNIVGRMLSLERAHHESEISSPKAGSGLNFASEQPQFLVTNQLLQLFSASLPRKHGAQKGRIVYTDGAWDMFHAGHISLLKRAKELGDYLIVGVHSDKVVNDYRGSNHPIMSMHERVLSVLGCRYVDDVLLDAPWAITREMVATLKVDVAARGTVHDCVSREDPDDPHAVPLSLGISVELPSEVSLTIDEILARMQERRTQVQARFRAKQQVETAWYNDKHGLDPRPQQT